jgi:ATP-dependent Clp protease ATP-binding subunit ClpA
VSTRFDRFLAGVINEATREAGTDGAVAVEAHHLLLAVARSGEPSTRAVLASVGLDHAAIRGAVDREFERSLAAAGVFLGAVDAPRPSHARGGSPRVGSSFRLALDRGLGSAARKKDLRPVHLLVGVMQARVGTVPRLLALAGVNRDALVERARRIVADDLT